MPQLESPQAGRGKFPDMGVQTARQRQSAPGKAEITGLQDRKVRLMMKNQTVISKENTAFFHAERHIRLASPPANRP